MPSQALHCVVTVVLWVIAHILLKAVHKEKKEMKMIRPIVAP